MRKELIYYSFMVPLILFSIYALMVIIGCVASACGAEQGFYCTIYCKIPLLLMAGVAALWMVKRSQTKTT